MKWIKHADQLPITEDVYSCSEDMILWYPKKRKIEFGFWWPIEMTWCDSESMGSFTEQPTYWCEVGKTPLQDMDGWFADDEYEPIDDGRVLVWRKDLPNVIYMAYYKDGIWMDHDFECPLPAHCQPSFWRNIPTPPVV